MIKTEFLDVFQDFFPFWDTLAQDDIDLLYKHTLQTTYKKNDHLHNGNGECTGAIFIQSGSLRVYMLSEDGKEITLFRLYAGDICMLSASCALSNITFDVLVDAVEDSQVCILNGCVFADIANRNIHMKNYALATALTSFSEAMWAMQQILFMSFDKRLAIFLMDEISKNGSDVIELTHDQVAKYMGSAREVVSRMLKRFATEGIVELHRGGITIKDKQKLRNLTR